MSRYVRLACPALSLPQLREQLEALGISHEVAGRRRVMLQGSLECEGEPVDVRCPPGEAGAVEDFGFVLDDGELRLVCGEVDQSHIEGELLQPLRQRLAEAEVRQMAERAGLEVERVTTDARGKKRIVLKDRG
jgi:hypothetical protein